MTVTAPCVVRVGVAVFVINHENKILVGRRRGSHGSGCYQLPGGHLDVGETIEECARREVLEETGLRLTDVEIITFTNDIFDKTNKHYVTIFTKCCIENSSASPKLMEPEKCEGWSWVELQDLQHCEHYQPLFLPLVHLFNQEPLLSNRLMYKS